MNIFYVDEESAWYDSWILELRLRGHEVTTIGDADRALRQLTDADDVGWAIIDVMLAGSEKGDSAFDLEDTDGGMETGLRLLEALSELGRAEYPTRCCLITNTSNERTYSSAEELSRSLGVWMLNKTDVDSPMEFADRIEAMVSGKYADLFGGPDDS